MHKGLLVIGWVCVCVCVCYNSSYQNNDIKEFEKILSANRQNIMEDLFIREHIEGKGIRLLYWLCIIDL